ncbi:5'-nucleotidase [Bacillus phage SP-15]|uniref:5'-nucleotidase n=1 Tax=Bacillus phage SP-15 TaxID=1792032 RepID=A0A127AW29_9CAUD|nr:dATP triphosphohydrolase [Bacillus phage SP-15]AMM44889.1 5'-nucleotidase [Bacillus phage SP-15]
MGEFVNQITSPQMRMDQVSRYSGTRQADPESVAIHVTDVSIMGYSLILRLNSQYGEDINVGEFLEKTIVHDIDEVLTGDVPRSTKYYNTTILNELRAVADTAMKHLSTKCFASDRVYTVWDESKQGKAGIIVKLADMLSVAKKTMIEIEMLGNNYFLKVAYEVRQYLAELVDYLNEKSPYNEEATQYLITILQDAESEVNRLWTDRKDIAERYGLLNNVW